MATDLYDTFVHWLTQQKDVDVIFLQELHWGCGRTENTWTIEGWQAIISADPKQRYSGVGIFISPRVAASAELTHAVCIPGRLLHVRCQRAKVTLDLVAIYQWVWQASKAAEIEVKRQELWTAFGHLMQRLPRRHLLIVERTSTRGATQFLVS